MTEPRFCEWCGAGTGHLRPQARYCTASCRTKASRARYPEKSAASAANLRDPEFKKIYNAFFLIGLDLTTRDALHDLWRRHRLPKMLALITAGAAISYAVNADAAKVAEASCVAFTAAALVDYAVYALLRRREWLERANVSNLAAAAVDSIVFPTIAFGGLMWGVTFGQFTAKVAGGVLWSLVLAYTRRPVAVPA